MEQGNIIKASTMLVDSLIKFVRSSQRILFPGVSVALFLDYRYSLKPFKNVLDTGLPSVILSVLIGTLIYFFYKSVIHRLIWAFQKRRKKYGIPQYEFHKKIVDEICSKENLSKTKYKLLHDNVSFSQACLWQFQQIVQDENKRGINWSFNSGSHLLFITLSLGVVFLSHDIFLAIFTLNSKVHFNVPLFTDYILWGILIVFGLLSGILFDRHADFRELMILVKHKEIYYEIISELNETIPNK